LRLMRLFPKAQAYLKFSNGTSYDLSIGFEIFCQFV